MWPRGGIGARAGAAALALTAPARECGAQPNPEASAIRQFANLLVLCLALAAAPVWADTLYRRGAAGEPATLDPQKSATVLEADVIYDLFEGLLSYDAEGELIPGVAESWTQSADGLTYLFHLRDSQWSNGDPVVAEDFVFAFRRLLDPATGAQYANLFWVFKNGEAVNKGEAKPETLGVEALDAHTLRVSLERPTPFLLGLLAHQTTVPVHRASVEAHGKDFTRPGNLVGNGAFTLTAFSPNDRISLTRNPRFHDAAKVSIEREDILALEDRSAARRRFEAGEIDSYSDVPADQIAFVRARFGDQFHLTPTLGVSYLAFNTRKPPFDDARVRMALSETIDREFLAERIWGGAMTPAESLTPPGIGDYGPPVFPAFHDLAPIEAEEQAKSLLREAGFGPAGKPLNVELRFNTSENNRATAVALADMWRPLGVTTSFVNTDVKTHFALLRQGGGFDAARAGWLADYSDPQNFLMLAKSGNEALNYSRYSNPAFDALLDRAETERDLNTRAKTLAEAETILLRDQPIAPLMFLTSKNLVSKRVSGWAENALDRHLTRYLSLAPRNP